MKKLKNKKTRFSLLSDFFDDSFLKPFDFYSFKIKDSKMPIADFSETKTLYKLDLQCPGYKPDDMLVELDGHNLTISGCQSSKKQEKDSTYLLKESSSHSFKRSFQLPNNANLEKITCKMEDGVLKLKVKKLKNSPKGKKTVPIKN